MPGQDAHGSCALMLSVNDEVLSSRKAGHLQGACFTYSAVGATRSHRLPSDYAILRRVRRIGSGAERFEEAARVLLGWDMHRKAGLRVRTSSKRVVRGAVAVLRLGLGPLSFAAPVRVVYVIDEPGRKGFAYGTLPGHPESGEEAFMVGTSYGWGRDVLYHRILAPANVPGPDRGSDKPGNSVAGHEPVFAFCMNRELPSSQLFANVSRTPQRVCSCCDQRGQ